MAESSKTGQRFRLRRPWTIKVVLAAVLLSELAGWGLLRRSAWQELGLGWQFWLVVAVLGGSVTLGVTWAVWFAQRRMQFGMRGLLAIVLLAGTGCGIVGMLLQRTERQRRAAAALESIGARVSYAGQETPGLLTFIGRQYLQEADAVGFQGPLRENDLLNIEALTSLEFLSLANSQLSDGNLERFSSLKQLGTLDLVICRVTGRGLKHLRTIPALRSVTLCQCPVDDEGLRYVGQLRALNVLNLNRTRVTDAGIVHLAELEQLGALYLDGTAITGTGLVHLRELPWLHHISLARAWIANDELVHLRDLPALRSLDLSYTGIDDDGVETLSGMSRLQSLQLHGTQISDEEVRKLQQRLPDCEIIH